MIEVDNQVVTKQIKKGRTLYTCSCENSGRFGNVQTCRHITFFIMFPFLDRIDIRINELIDFYKVARTQTKNDDVKKNFDFIISDLKELRRIRL
jgi:hypothetical protein